MPYIAKKLGSIRQRTTHSKTNPQRYWEGRITVGYDVDGKQIQRTVTAKTQKHLEQKMMQIADEVRTGTYNKAPSMTVDTFIETWLDNFCLDLKETTRRNYRQTAKKHIMPALGAVDLNKLRAEQIQNLYLKLLSGQPPLSPKTIKNIHGLLHRALNKAVQLRYIDYNPVNGCTIPKVRKPEIKPMEKEEILRFLQEIKGDELEIFFFVALFTGMRRGELMGLTWDDVSFERQQVRVHKQLTQFAGDLQYQFTTPKNGKERIIQAAPLVFDRLKMLKEQQEAVREKNSHAWNNTNLVFTNERGENLSIRKIEKHFKKCVKNIGRPDVRLHDLRHSYAILSILAGDDIKILQENLGHYSAAFTLDVYGSVIREMQNRSAQNMQNYMINSLLL